MCREWNISEYIMWLIKVSKVIIIVHIENK